MVTRNQSNAKFRSEVHDILGRHKNSLDQIHATLQTILSELQSLRASHAIASKTNPFAPATSSHQVPQPTTSNNTPLTGVVFAPFEEVKKELDLVPNVPQVSLARPKYSDESEATINEQINVEYNVPYVYHAMFAYFDRDNVGPKESSLQEREHAKKLMEYQNKRGGKVKLQSIVMPLNEFDHVEKGDALYAMELALSLEKLTNEKLFNLHQVANRNKYMQLADFIEIEFLTEQDEDSFYPCGQG